MFRRGEIWYASFTTAGGKRIKQSLGTSDKQQAQELHDKLKADSWRHLKMGEPVSMTFEEACVRWVHEKAEKKSLWDDKDQISFWLPFLSGRQLRDITEREIYSAVAKVENRNHLNRWKKQAAACIRKGKEPPVYEPKLATLGTKIKRLSFLRSLLRAAEREWRVLEKAPLVKVPVAKERRIRWLKPEEAQRLISECSEPLKSTVEFALSTGLRRSNITNLKWEQIDLQKRMAWIYADESKSGRAIGVALNDTACAVLRKNIGRHQEYVFVYVESKKDNSGEISKVTRPVSSNANKGWKAALRRAGIEDFRFHDLRHTWASWLIMSGVPISVLQEMGGWQTIDMVRRYAHFSSGHLSQHAKLIDDIFMKNVPNMSHSTLRNGTQDD
ncbi:site-specific integrase [Pantoea anthophila]|uniref:site-specific integrase n=1 Tax=Pantoea anthophila TaxID=470931 RepID=UPI003019C630